MPTGCTCWARRHRLAHPHLEESAPRRGAGSELVTIAFLLALALGGLDADLFVILLEGREVLSRLAELALLHALANIPMHEGALAVHEIELVVDARENLGDRRRVADHAASAHHLGQVTARDYGGGLVIDAAFEARRAPIYELDRP